MYTMLINHGIGWQEDGEILANGSSISGNNRIYYFYGNGDFQLVCEASDNSCLVSNNNTGSWSFITSSTIQIVTNNGAILFYNVVRLDPSNLWFQDNNTRNQQILRECVPL